MPYTAPAQLSLPAPRLDHPLSHSLRKDSSGLPHLPRAFSSTSYVRRHRRSPSVSKLTVSLPAVESSGYTVSPFQSTVGPHASLRQWPPPVNNAMIPTGALISPPESGANSSDDEGTTSETTRFPVALDKLDAAIRSIQQECCSPTAEQPREGGTVEDKVAFSSAEGLPNKLPNARPSLTVEAPKISHVRSSTESSISELAEHLSPSDEEELVPKPPMVRKKSGELVRPALRPASGRRRPSSMPGTPTYAKNVHFDTQLEHIKHFLQLDRPLAVSADTSPVETYRGDSEYPFSSSDSEGGSKASAFEWELRLANFPKDTTSRDHMPVRLERMFLSSDNKNLVGVVAVANLAFHKQVAARFTFDYWRTVSEVAAEYNHDVRRKHAHDGYDRFNFTIKLADQANLEAKTMFVCIRYNVSGREFWDNNASMNYQVDFAKKYKNNTPGKHSVPPTNGRHVQPLPRSRSLPTSSAARPRSTPPSFDDFASEIDTTFPSFSQGSSKNHLRQADTHDLLLETPRRMEKPARQAFGNRYDFGVSLSAAMKSKNTTQDRTTLSAKAKSENQPQSGSKSHNNDGVGQNSSELSADPTAGTNGNSKDTTDPGSLKPSTIVSSKPHLESSVYKELVDKYCFFGSAKSALIPDRTVSSSGVKPVRFYHEGTHSSSSSSVAGQTYDEFISPVDSAISINSSQHSSGSSSASSSNQSSHASSPVILFLTVPPA
ncbi:hypothetical protein VTN77DRAFT_6989 [Rasamsonia byssochlamydoides]|uniref:uncharacterized protein n=1 Tax=Rasamsonia byssochlamydoides TaxID=89139 RepID=UPI003742E04A